jgi:hypothetical protein
MFLLGSFVALPIVTYFHLRLLVLVFLVVSCVRCHHGPSFEYIHRAALFCPDDGCQMSDAMSLVFIYGRGRKRASRLPTCVPVPVWSCCCAACCVTLFRLGSVQRKQTREFRLGQGSLSTRYHSFVHNIRFDPPGLGHRVRSFALGVGRGPPLANSKFKMDKWKGPILID